MMPNGRDRRFIGEDGYAGSDGDFPAEQPNYDILKAWLDKTKDALFTSGVQSTETGQAPA